MHPRLRHRTPLQIPRRPGDSLILDEESRHLIEDANLLIDRDRILLLEIIGQGMHTSLQVYVGIYMRQNQCRFDSDPE